MENPPTFLISKQCCRGAKKDTAHLLDIEYNSNLKIIGVRRAEGGLRSTSYTSCFSIPTDAGIAEYRPLYFWSDKDKAHYKEMRGLRYSDCYEVWGMKRTGYAGCPFGSRFEEELQLISRYEPRLYQAVNNIFGLSYDYTRKYRKFKECYKR